MMADTRPTACVSFKKTLMNQYNKVEFFERRFTTFIIMIIKNKIKY